MFHDITVICSEYDSDGNRQFDWTVFATGLVRVGEIEVESMEDLIHKVTGRMASGDRLRHLRLFAHGSNAGFSIGSDPITTISPKTNVQGLARLAPSFDAQGALSLYVCEIGQAHGILGALAGVMGVPVYACKGSVEPNIGMLLPTPGGLEGFLGPLIVAFPDGTFRCDETVRYPDRRAPIGRPIAA